MKNVIQHILIGYEKYFTKLEYATVFKDLKLKYEQQTEEVSVSSRPNTTDVFETVDVQEEAYFNMEDEIEKMDSPPLEFVKGKPLVPYTLEDEEDEHQMETEEEEIQLKPKQVKKGLKIELRVSKKRKKV
jgi:prolyl oligopeptidase PreP (S9A serine peptidase family)